MTSIHRFFITPFLLLLLLIFIFQLTACSPLLTTEGTGSLSHSMGRTNRQRETRNTLTQARKLIRQGKLKKANQVLSSLHNTDMEIRGKNEYHFLSGLIFALKEYEYQNYQRALRHLEQVKDDPEDQSLYPVYSRLLSYLLHDVIRQYYQIKELEKTIDQQEREIMNNQDACSTLKTTADSLAESCRELREKNQQLKEKIKAIMKIDTE
jgi:chromosome segregation ATPase